MALLFASAPSWAGPPNPTASDALGNTAGGSNALLSNTTGPGNTGFGIYALVSNTAGGGNTAFGTDVLVSNTTGLDNTGSGLSALYNNTTGSLNTASGLNALFNNTTADRNTAIGANVLYSNTTGRDNTASGINTMFFNTTGTDNTATGGGALYNNTTGIENTASGVIAGLSNTTGNHDTFIGFDADANGNYTNGTALGAGALLFASNSIVLGDTSISAIYANVSSISALSDRRRKKDIAPLGSDLGLDFIEKLKPVSYRFNNGDETVRYGFIAQELEQALPAALHGTIEGSQPEHGVALIGRQNDKDRTYRVSYNELLAPIVKAIQEQQQEIAAERRQNADLRRAVAALQSKLATFKAENDALRHSIAALKYQVTAAR